jgi:uncharacterized damage-inducible protein DinB
MISTIIKNLDKATYLLDSISQEQYVNTSVAPYNSSIGGHVRHVLDVFKCVFIGREIKEIDLTLRDRDLEVEQDIEKCKEYINSVTANLKVISLAELNELVSVVDDLGDGKEKATYTLGAILIQAHSHATHHYASIGYIIHQLGIELPDDTFGFNPTTPKKVLQS